MATDPNPNFIPLSAKGEKCNMCGKKAARKVEECIFDDDPSSWREIGMGGGFNRILSRHPFTAYLCLECFKKVMHLK